jgi:hypothetical protein
MVTLTLLREDLADLLTAMTSTPQSTLVPWRFVITASTMTATF